MDAARPSGGQTDLLPTLFDVAQAHVRKHHAARNSMFTVETYDFCAGDRQGEVMLKWWRDCPGMLLIKQVALTPRGTEPRGVLTTTANKLLEDDELLALGLRTVRVESVLKHTLLLKLGVSGWFLDGRQYGASDDHLSGCADKTQTRLCCFCGKSTGVHGNNPTPAQPDTAAADKGQCCDECNLRVVLPARSAEAQRGTI